MKKKCCVDADARQPSREDVSLAQLANALGHPARVAIVRRLQERESCICGDIVDSLPLAQSTVSQHLKILKEAGVVRTEVDGSRVCYCLNVEVIAYLKKLMAGLSGAGDNACGRRAGKRVAVQAIKSGTDRRVRIRTKTESLR